MGGALRVFAGALLTSSATFGEASQVAARGLIQVDLRDFVGPSPEADRSDFVVRFAGAQVDAAAEERLRARILVNLAESKLGLSEAWMELAATPWLNLRAGKFPYPITQERLTSVLSLPFVNSSPSSFLLPAKDTGVQVWGIVAGGAVAYNLALVD